MYLMQLYPDATKPHLPVLLPLLVEVAAQQGPDVSAIPASKLADIAPAGSDLKSAQVSSTQ